MTDYAHIPPPPPPPLSQGGTPAGLAVSPYASSAGSHPPAAARRRGWILGAGAFAVVALVFGVVAVTRAGDARPASALAAAAARTEAQKTARVEMTMSLPLAGVTRPMVVTGEVDFTNQSSRFVLDLSGIAGATDPRIDLTQSDIEVVATGFVSYVKMPGFEKLTGSSAKWVKVDYAKVAKTRTGADLEKTLSQQGNDPSRMLELLKNETKSMTEVGRDVVRGVGTTHYTATIDLVKAYRSSGAVVDDQKLAELVNGLEGVVTADVWIGDDGLVRKQTTTMPTTGGDVSFTIELFDFGAPVAVQVPADADTIDLTAILGNK